MGEMDKVQINTTSITGVNINWAAISSMATAMVDVVNTQNGTAAIDWVYIKDLSTVTAIITQSICGELHIAKPAVTEANLVSLSVVEPVIKGEDGHKITDNAIIQTVHNDAQCQADIASASARGGRLCLHSRHTNIHYSHMDRGCKHPFLASWIGIHRLASMQQYRICKKRCFRFGEKYKYNIENCMDYCTNNRYSICDKRRYLAKGGCL